MTKENVEIHRSSGRADKKCAGRSPVKNGPKNVHRTPRSESQDKMDIATSVENGVVLNEGAQGTVKRKRGWPKGVKRGPVNHLKRGPKKKPPVFVKKGPGRLVKKVPGRRGRPPGRPPKVTVTTVYLQMYNPFSYFRVPASAPRLV